MKKSKYHKQLIEINNPDEMVLDLIIYRKTYANTLFVKEL